MGRKFMKNTNIYIVTILFFVFGCSIAKNYSDSQVRGNGTSISEIRDLKEFTEIEMSIAYDKIVVNFGAVQSLQIIGDENIIPLIKTRVSNGVLTISSDSSFQTKVESEIVINMISLKKFIFDGVGESIINKMNEEHFICTLNGVGSCELNGSVVNFELSVNGVGSINAKELIGDKVVASLNGVGSAEVYATNSLNASVNGIGGLTYYGDPEKIILNDSGLGSISKGD